MKRTREQVIWDFVQGWIQKAEGDLRAAECLLGVKQEDHFTAAFHAQQSAEKFLKAFLVRHQVVFTKTHDIRQLLELAGHADPALRAELSSAVMLTPFGVEFRYPGEEIITYDNAREAVREAGRVKAVIQERLKDYLGKGRP